ncbi:MAG: hypothetical protein GY809_18455, partial [Planctomycetes bacterium]|nr:hypothetical protein [Planctomycetota bacterium]
MKTGQSQRTFLKRVSQLLHYTRPYTKWLILAGVCLLSGAVLAVGIPLFTGRVVDAVSNEDLASSLHISIYWLLGLMAAHALVTFLGSLLTSWTDERILLDVRAHVFQQLQQIPYLHLSEHKHGELVSRVSYDVEIIGSATTSNLISLIQ